MNHKHSAKSTAIAIGILYLLATVTYMTGAFVLIEPAISGSDYLNTLFARNKSALRMGVMLQFVNDVAIVGIGVLMLRILRRYNENIAVAVLVARILEATILIVGGIGLLMLVPLSNEFIKSGGMAGSYFDTMGLVVKRWYAASFNTAMLCLGIGGFFLSYLLYKYKLVPRAISLPGLVGYPILFVKILLDIFAFPNGGPFLFLPVGLFELVFPIWLFVKGFPLHALSPASAEIEKP
ncbi:MAG: DUF4386 domain-containing protein [Bacteroidota bacterium]|nr:DUF4386 domain-containing protein [Flavisolibacter sp.]MBD0374720.1 DUF4386 domain-containing protein [Flavisolibacter sp.]MDQ3845836.1 DUF4386 domain-containing protein [Bacteroidota bacterium]